MPQTLLAISAIVITGFLTLSQGEISRRTGESVVVDQFELAVAGTLLHTMEFVDSRAFDKATTPEKLRQRLKLPRVMPRAMRDTISFDDLRMIQASDFDTPSSFGTGNCDILNPPASCADVDDIADGRWHALDLETPEGDPLPVEVRVNVAYVEAAAGKAIDEPVGGTKRTFHKRVEVIARSNAIRTSGGGSRPVQVALRRVISFDPEVAAEYLRRSIRTVEEGPEACEAEVGPWNERVGELRDALQAAQDAERAAALAVAGAEGVLAEARTKVTQKKTAYDNAVTKVAQAQSSFEAARDELVPLLNKHTVYHNGTYYRKSGVTDAQWNQVIQSYNRYIGRRDAHDTAVAERDAAQRASKDADDELAAAQKPVDDARAAAAAASAAASAAAKAVRDHEATRPECDDQD